MQHDYHHELHEDATLLSKKDLKSDQLDFLELMYDNGVTSSTIANIMSTVVNKNGGKGEFIPSTINNITKEMKEAMDAIAGISADFSIAEKTIHRLNA